MGNLKESMKKAIQAIYNHENVGQTNWFEELDRLLPSLNGYPHQPNATTDLNDVVTEFLTEKDEELSDEWGVVEIYFKKLDDLLNPKTEEFDFDDKDNLDTLVAICKEINSTKNAKDNKKLQVFAYQAAAKSFAFEPLKVFENKISNECAISIFKKIVIAKDSNYLNVKEKKNLEIAEQLLFDFVKDRDLFNTQAKEYLEELANQKSTTINPKNQPKSSQPSQSEQPKSGQPSQSEQPKSGQPSQSEQPKSGQPSQSEHPKSGQPSQSEQPKSGQPSQSEQPKSGQPSQSEQPKSGQPSQSEQPKSGQPSQSEQPKSGQPSQSEQSKSTSNTPPFIPSDGFYDSYRGLVNDVNSLIQELAKIEKEIKQVEELIKNDLYDTQALERLISLQGTAKNIYNTIQNKKLALSNLEFAEYKKNPMYYAKNDKNLEKDKIDYEPLRPTDNIIDNYKFHMNLLDKIKVENQDYDHLSDAVQAVYGVRDRRMLFEVQFNKDFKLDTFITEVKSIENTQKPSNVNAPQPDPIEPQPDPNPTEPQPDQTVPGANDNYKKSLDRYFDTFSSKMIVEFINMYFSDPNALIEYEEFKNDEKNIKMFEEYVNNRLQDYVKSTKNNNLLQIIEENNKFIMVVKENGQEKARKEIKMIGLKARLRARLNKDKLLKNDTKINQSKLFLTDEEITKVTGALVKMVSVHELRSSVDEVQKLYNERIQEKLQQLNIDGTDLKAEVVETKDGKKVDILKEGKSMATIKYTYQDLRKELEELKEKLQKMGNQEPEVTSSLGR